MPDIRRDVFVSQPGRRRIFCNSCARETNHEVLYSRTVKCEQSLSDHPDENDHCIDWTDTHSLIECCGCEDTRMLHEYWFSEDWDVEGPIAYKKYYPPNEVRHMPDWIGSLPAEVIEIRELLGEIYRALAVDALRVATMGIRALVEKLMIDRVGDRGSFEKTIPAFFDAGYVAVFQQERFRDTLIESGHAAMHRGWEPRADEVMTLLDIVEGLLKSIYVDLDAATKVGKRIPARPPRR